MSHELMDAASSPNHQFSLRDSNHELVRLQEICVRGSLLPPIEVLQIDDSDLARWFQRPVPLIEVRSVHKSCGSVLKRPGSAINMTDDVDLGLHCFDGLEQLFASEMLAPDAA